MKTGRKLTERQKAERAAGREATRQAEELGPLFADQAVRPDVDALLMERRLGRREKGTIPSSGRRAAWTSSTGSTNGT